MIPILRAMTAADLEQVIALVNQTAGAPQWSSEEYRRMLSAKGGELLERFALVAYSGDVFAGFAVASLLRGDDLAELEMIAVHPHQRRHGVGSALLNAVMQTASRAGARAMHLEVRPSNSAALAFYLRRGFHESGRRPAYYRAPLEDALLLKASLRVAVD